MLDKFHEECGVVAIYGHPEASKLAYLSLYALQHRGQESAGISSSDGTVIHTTKAMGHVSDIFTDIGKDTEYRRQMTEQGLEIVDVPYDKMAAFMEERKKAYLSSAKLLGLVK